MKQPKYDGVIEAAHFTPDGKIDWVRYYERRGSTFSDRLLMKRDTLVQLVKAGKKFYAGKRTPLMAGTFEVSQPIRLVQNDGDEVLVTGEKQADRDTLEGVPFI